LPQNPDYVPTRIIYDDIYTFPVCVALFYLLRNYILSYLVDVNAPLSLTSTGVRGMKYKSHLLVGTLIPSMISSNTGTLIPLSKRMPSISGGGKFDTLTDLALELLVDLATHRKS
jgi:hypothetical protein